MNSPRTLCQKYGETLGEHLVADITDSTRQQCAAIALKIGTEKLAAYVEGDAPLPARAAVQATYQEIVKAILDSGRL